MTEIPRETLHEILRKWTPCFEERVNAVKAFMDTPTHSIQQVILVEDAVAEMKAILFDANIVEAVVRMNHVDLTLYYASGDKYWVFCEQRGFTVRGINTPLEETTVIKWKSLPALVEKAWEV